MVVKGRADIHADMHDGSERVQVKEITGEVEHRYVRIDGVLIPCVSGIWLRAENYVNPFRPPLHDLATPKDREFVVVLLQRQRVVVTDDMPERDAQGVVTALIRRGYVGLHAITDASFSPEEGLSFRLGSLIAKLD
jgi:hypothetical protein